MWWSQLILPGLGGVFEIIVLAYCAYLIFRFFRGTPGAKVLVGLVVLLVVVLGLTKIFHLAALNWLFRQFSVYLVVGLLVIFQPEIRRVLAELGKQHVFGPGIEPRTVVDNVVQAVLLLAERRIGGLIAIEREIGTKAIQETGIELDSRVTAELLASIFYPRTPLHDGGVIISGTKIVAAACLFPLTQRADVSKGLGTRHRAAIGITEETDAVAVVVSEETGTISVSYRGRLSRDLDGERLRRFLSALLVKQQQERAPLWRTAGKLLLHPGELMKGQAKEPNGDPTLWPWLRRKLVSHKGLKLAAIMLAVAAWYSIRDAVSFEVDIRDVPLQIRAKDGTAILDQSVNMVDVTFRGAQDDIRALDQTRRGLPSGPMRKTCALWSI